MLFKHLLFALLLVASVTVLAGDDTQELPTVQSDPIVVTAHRGETPANQVGSSFTVITAEDIAKSGQVQVADLLRTVPGLDVVRSGGLGQVASIFIRGANSAHTLVMVDGTEVNDPMSPGNAYDFAHLALENIERIEIVRGPQSTVYGSDAMAGVIHIITKQGRQGHHLGLDLEGRSHGTHREVVRADGRNARLDYSLSASNLESRGYSLSTPEGDKDGYEHRDLSARLGFVLSDNWSLGLITRYADGKADIDGGPGPFGDDPNYWTDAQETQIKAKTNWNLSEGRWLGELSVAMEKIDRESVNAVDTAHPVDRVNATYAGERQRFNWQNVLKLGEVQLLTVGFDHEEDRGDSVYDSDSVFGPYVAVFEEQKARTSGLYLQDHLTFDDLALTVGGRFDDHDRFGSKATWRVAGSYRMVGEAYLKASLGTGFKAPSLFQLYSSSGNLELEAEESLGWDFGVQYALPSAQLNLGLSIFSNEYDNLIDFSSATFTYANFGKVDTSGLELTLDWRINQSLLLGASFTSTRAEDAQGDQLVRRPRSKANLHASWAINKRASTLIELRHVGTRSDFDFVNFTGKVDLDAYTLVNLGGTLQFGHNIGLSVRVDNLFDEDYDEVFGYTTPGATGSVGLHLNY